MTKMFKTREMLIMLIMIILMSIKAAYNTRKVNNVNPEEKILGKGGFMGILMRSA